MSVCVGLAWLLDRYTRGRACERPKCSLSCLQIISGLEKMTGLRVLDLHGNAIRTIANTAHLRALTVLNLADNCLVSLEGLGTLASLQVCTDDVHDYAMCVPVRATEYGSSNKSGFETHRRSWTCTTTALGISQPRSAL